MIQLMDEMGKLSDLGPSREPPGLPYRAAPPPMPVQQRIDPVPFDEGSGVLMGSPPARSLVGQLPSSQFPAFPSAAQLSADRPLFGNRSRIGDGDFGLGSGGDKKDKKQKGGYVRDGSKFPEEFYSKAS
jgi:hypothetical protein